MIPLRDSIPSRRPPVMMWIIILANVLVFAVQLAMPQRELTRFIYIFGMVPRRFSHPEWAQWVGFPVDDYWPFLTSLFIHGGWLHIIFNMWSLWIFGDNVEDRMGPFRFLIFYLLCGIASGVSHVMLNTDSTVPAIGASGAIAGVLSAYLILYPRANVICMIPIFIFPFFFEIRAWFFILFWFGLQLFNGGLSLVNPTAGGGIAWWAHVGGFAAGIILLPLFLSRRPPGEEEPVSQKVVSVEQAPRRW